MATQKQIEAAATKLRDNFVKRQAEHAGSIATWVNFQEDAKATLDVAEDAAWEPIGTAPKDGTWILGWRDEEQDDKWSNCEVVKWRTRGRNSTNLPGWYDSRIFPQTVTHWRPLPPPPADKK